MIVRALLTSLLLTTSAAATAVAGPNDLTVTSEVVGKDFNTYRELPFEVPAGTKRIAIDIEEQPLKAAGVVVDIGIKDPTRTRGWSGSNKHEIVIGETDATPSYQPGALPAGTWHFILGFPKVSPGAQTRFVAHIHFASEADGFTDLLPPIKTADGWYRGDLHMHSAHSDGTCNSALGQEVPCPVFRTLEAASARKLDFLVLSDHNGSAQMQSLRELAPYFDNLLLIPGREVTTFQGHANAIGTTDDLPFELGTPALPATAPLADAVHKAGGLLSINHPALPSGVACMGCGWTAITDWTKVDAIEVVNGGTAHRLGTDSPMSGLSFWDGLLKRGAHVTAVGGSDNHDPNEVGHLGGIGRPMTVVHAAGLSTPAILAGIRAGHVFLDLTEQGNAMLTMEARSDNKRAEAGDQIDPGKNGVHLKLTTRLPNPDMTLILISGSGEAETSQRYPLRQRAGTLEINLPAGDKSNWIRAEIRSPDGKLQLLSNPIYFKRNS